MVRFRNSLPTLHQLTHRPPSLLFSVYSQA